MRVICSGSQWIANIEAIAFAERLDNVVKVHFLNGESSMWTAESIEEAQAIMGTLENFLLGDQVKKMIIGNNQ